MSELPNQFMAAEQGSSEPVAEQVLNPELAQARLRVQTIQRFLALEMTIGNILDPEEFSQAWVKFDTLTKKEYGRAWELLKKPGVEAIPMVIGGKTKDELKQALTANGFGYYEQLMNDPDLVTLLQSEPIVLVRLTPVNLGLFTPPTTDELFARAKEYGLELCPPEVGPWYRLQMRNQSMDVCVGTQPIMNSNGNSYFFSINNDEEGGMLYEYFTAPESKWNLDDNFLFTLPILHSKQSEVNHA